MKTTLDLPDPIVRQVKLKALQKGKKLKDMIADLLERGLASLETPSADMNFNDREPSTSKQSYSESVEPSWKLQEQESAVLERGAARDLKFSENELNEIFKITGKMNIEDALHKVVASFLMLRRRQEIAARFISGEWSADFEGWEASRALDRQKTENLEAVLLG